MCVLLIASAAYVDPELEAEFGRLPPAFLPLGNRRLFAHQLAELRATTERVLLSIPEDFQPDAADLRFLENEGVELVPVPTGLTLGQSVVYVINITGIVGRSLAINYGDTLLKGLDLSASDLASVVHASPDIYSWGNVLDRDGQLLPVRPPPSILQQSGRLHEIADVTQTKDAILTGFFRFSDVAFLVQCVTRQGGDFLAGVAEYATVRDVRTRGATEWYDFGHAATYHRSRRHVSTAREFNCLIAGRRTVTKSGSKPQKIHAEALWFEMLPPALRIHTPAYLGRQDDSAAYQLEYLNYPTLSDLYVFGRLSRRTWDRIFVACDEFLTACVSHPAPAEIAERVVTDGAKLYLEKTIARLEQQARETGLQLDEPCRLSGFWLPSLERMARIAAAAIPSCQLSHATLMHGDFCFSNILYDIRSDMVRVIDPRGLDASGMPSIFGDVRYDLGKLHHSAVGQYDHIVAGNFRLNRQGPLEFALELPDGSAVRDVAEAYLGRTFGGLSPVQAAAPAISVLLFLSMLPLHADAPQRQAALLANAMRLFLTLDGGHEAAA